MAEGRLMTTQRDSVGHIGLAMCRPLNLLDTFTFGAQLQLKKVHGGLLSAKGSSEVQQLLLHSCQSEINTDVRKKRKWSMLIDTVEEQEEVVVALEKKKREMGLTAVLTCVGLSQV